MVVYIMGATITGTVLVKSSHAKGINTVVCNSTYYLGQARVMMLPSCPKYMVVNSLLKFKQLIQNLVNYTIALS